MAYEDLTRAPEKPHGLTLDGRNKLSVSGVTDVDSFDDTSIVMITGKGDLSVEGHDLRIEKLSLDTGEVVVRGEIDSLEYTDSAPQASGWFGRLINRP